MALQISTPGVYVQERPGGGGIVPVATSIAAFVGWSRSGPLGQATQVLSWSDYEQAFGGLDGGELGYAVFSFYQNGGGEAWITRVVGADGGRPGADDLVGDPTTRTGLHALDSVDLFNLLCLPDLRTFPLAAHAIVAGAASAYCQMQRAMLLLDLPCAITDGAPRFDDALNWIRNQATGELGPAAINAAAYWPEPLISDPLVPTQSRPVAASGLMAGLIAFNDASRGIWAAAAGPNLPASGVLGVSVPMTDAQSGQINLLGLNAIRELTGFGLVPWGARTMGSAQSPDWTYIPVRRLALHIEESLSRGLAWTVFEPNDPALWSAIRLEVGAFMHALYLQGAFLGATASEAYWVNCDASTTTGDDIAAGVACVQIGFAPTRPAEFIVLSMQVSASQAD